MALLGFLLLCLAVGLVDLAIIEPGMRRWYPLLRHPPGTPPAWLFPAVWLPLYAAIAVSAWRIWRWSPIDRLREPGRIAFRSKAGQGGLALRRRGLQLWGWQLAANALWTPFLFGLHRPQAALGLILSVALLVGLTIRDFHKLDRPAGILMSATLAWVCYAAWLNAGIAWLNPA